MTNPAELPKFELPKKPSRQSQWLNLDVLAVLVFVVIGRDTHENGFDASGVIETAAPFTIALVVGWFAAKAWRKPTELMTGVVTWPITVVVGMALRRLAFDRGTAAAFVIVATIFLGVTLVGWRFVYRVVASHFANKGSSELPPLN